MSGCSQYSSTWTREINEMRDRLLLAPGRCRNSHTLATVANSCLARQRERHAEHEMLVSPVGFEPTTQGLKVPRSAAELRAHAA